MSEESPSHPRLRLAVAAMLFSTGGAAIKATTLTGWQVASYRSGVAALTFALCVRGATRAWSWRAVLVAIAYAATLCSFVLANKLTTAANTIFLQSTAPLYLLLLGPWLLHEPLRRQDLWFVAAMLIGLALFFVGAETRAATAPNPALGNVIAGFSGASWALTIVGLRWLSSRGGGSAADESARADAGSSCILIGNALACLFCLPMAAPAGLPAGRDLVIILFLGTLQIGLAYILVTSALRAVPALEASALLLIEPAFNPIWAFIFHGERPSRFALAGGGLILGATMVKTWRDTQRGIE
jgi:drug/metabolite transporter (DMT)-like permease